MSKIHVQSDRFLFFCPGCECAHAINATWTFNGDIDKPTISPSIRVRSHDTSGDTCCHSFVKDGKIQFLGDCTHKLKGTTVEIPDWGSIFDTK